tara:strand:- start:5 stop:451 length:447 start_codon:yes stop_codon:yes gene_type:complete
MFRISYLLLIFVVIFSNKVSAGPFTDNLTRCILVSTDEDDYTKLVNWIFRVVAEHPDIKSDVGDVYSKNQKIMADVNLAEVFTKLLTKRCKTESIQAFKYEQDIALFESFKILGEISMQKMMADPAVSKSVEEFTKYMDEKAIEELFE